MRNDHVKFFIEAGMGIILGLGLYGCVSERLEDTSSRTIHFGARTEASAPTRTSYSGVTDASLVERIDWVNGDKVRIYSDEASSPSVKYADYSLTLTGNEGIYSTGRLSPVGEGLAWGEGTHSFFAIYPAPSSTEVQGGDPNLSFSEGSGVMEAAIPADQSGSTHTTDQNPAVTYYGNMDLAYMTAAASGAEGSDISLTFTLVVTTFYATITNTTGADMTLMQVALSSETSALTGVFKTSFNASNARTYSYLQGTSWTGSPVRTEENSTITASFTGLTLAANASVTVALFTFPTDVTGLTLSVTSAEAGTVSLPLKDGDSWISFPAGFKHNINNVNVPSVDFSLTVTDPLGAAVSSLTYDGTGAATDAQAFTVTHARSIGSTASPLAWKTQIYDETTNAWVDLEGNCPDWLENFPLNSTGATTADGTISDTPAPAHTYRVNVGEQPVTSHEDMLKSVPALGTESAPLDLSKWNFVTKQTEPRYTANCYVVQAPGWYCFPLVYGNGIENNVVARASYEGKTLRAGHLDEFKKMDDFSIYAAPGAPWLQKDSFTDYHAGVRLQWQKYSYWDESSQTVVTAGNNYNNQYDVASDTPQTVANPQQVIKNLDVYQGTDGWYIKFYVDPETIRPGNALIASLDRDNDICWSWHIWITDQDMSPVTVGSSQVLPVNLGWVDLEKGLFYAERSRKLKFVSTEKEGVESDEITVIQPEYEKESTTGWQTYYQWGRKDPLAEKLTRVYDDDGLLKEAIKHPNNIQYDAGHNSGNVYYDWTSANYNNLWDSKWTDYGVSSNSLPVHKTVYDPSPRKFCVSPEIWDFGTLGYEGAFESGYHFHTSGTSAGTLFFPASGYMDFLDAQIKSEGTEGRYWTTHPAGTGTQQRISYCLKFTGAAVDDVYSALMYRSYGYSVRPVSFNLSAPAPSETVKRKEVVFGDGYWTSNQNLSGKSIAITDDSDNTLFTISFENQHLFDTTNPPQYKANGGYVQLDQNNKMTVTASSAVKTISSVSFVLQKAGNITITTDPSDTFSNGVWLNETGTDVSAVSFTTGDRFAAIEWELTGLIITYEIP